MSVRVRYTSRPSYLCPKLIQVFTKDPNGFLRTRPILSNGEQMWSSRVLASAVDEIGDKIPLNMFDGVEPESVNAIPEGRNDPSSPVEEIIGNLRVFMIDIGTH